ncbi:RHS repeat-associated core domain-containing protein [Pseudomonas asturiensis]|uniref:RHS repeat-associated core domain-containing protein n=1 Tax=Pseudomonas asturiensis TaxID=1190415 RepID=A0A1M7NJN4_9PSED|nr:RHS repeat-associated core domain-containing protein [Pseudomonas asturiensis]SHN04064.1 RHS repeat-associated core domain-containing protein [Pseudomonas asturiensis]
MAGSAPVVLCIYRYDALDRLASCAVHGQASVLFFYQRNRLTTQVRGAVRHSLFQTENDVLAQQNQIGNHMDCLPVSIDQQGSIIAAPQQAFTYTAYGTRTPSTDPGRLPGFNGQPVDPLTGHYLLGNGYRSFNPVLLRFNSPDSLSPFGEGGLNAYAYCLGDPVNRKDPTGHVPGLQGIQKAVSRLSGAFYKASQRVRRALFGPTKMRLSNGRDLSGVALYDRIKKNGKKELLISAHGTRPSNSDGSFIYLDNKPIAADAFYNELRRNSVDLDNYESIRTVVCYSGDGSVPFGETLSSITGLPVKSYKGKVTASMVLDNSQVRGVRPSYIEKTNPFEKGTERSRWFTYEPVWYGRPDK